MAKTVKCSDDLNVSSERFHCVRKQYIFLRFTLSTGHSVYDILNKRLDKGGDALCLILVVRVSLIIPFALFSGVLLLSIILIA